MNILVTGANGFIGSALCRTLENAQLNVNALVRREETPVVGKKLVLDLTANQAATALKKITHNVNAIVHTIGLTHQEAQDANSESDQFRAVNVETSRLLAEAAVENDVSLFVYLSSVKAVGESTPKQANGSVIPFTDDSIPDPRDEYGRSKLEAERLLIDRLQASNTQLVILRPPLVYGPGQKGNMRKLFDLVQRRVPLPITGITNTRSIISVANLCDAILTVLTNPRESDKPYFVTDSRLSTQQLVENIAQALAVTTRSFPCPIFFLKVAAALIGKAQDVDKIIGSLVLDDSRFRADYNWRPQVAIEQVLAQIATREYLSK